MWVYALCERFTAISPTLLPILLDAAIKGFLLLLLTSAATLAMRRTSAAARHLVWFLGVLSLLILPILSAGLPGWHILPRIVLAAPTASSAVFSSPGTPGEARGSDDRPQAGNRSAGGGHLPSEISDLKSPNDPHPNPLPEYRARGKAAARRFCRRRFGPISA